MDYLSNAIEGYDAMRRNQIRRGTYKGRTFRENGLAVDPDPELEALEEKLTWPKKKPHETFVATSTARSSPGEFDAEIIEELGEQIYDLFKT